jgi:hypothetical protein
MMDLSLSSHHLPSLLPLGPTHKSSPAGGRVYTLVVTWSPDGVGRSRPVLGLRRHLDSAGPLHRGAAANAGPAPTRPFVVRAGLGERLELHVTNLLAHMPLDLALVDDDFGIMENTTARELAHGETHTYRWHCRHAGVFPVFNRACPDPMERRSLLGVLIVEP